MIETYAKEFKAIVKHLKKDEQSRITGDFLISHKETVIELLNKNAYDTACNKLKIWKGLNWLDTDDNRLTKRMLDKETKQRIPSLKISLKVYEMLEKINVK